MHTHLYTPYGASYDLHQALDRVYIPDFVVQPVSPETLEQLNSSATSRMIIFGEYSDFTIFGQRLNNYRQRAHHDAIHLRLQADTSVEGEARVARQQALEIERVSGTQLADIIYADLYGQTAHMVKFNSFPTDQASFVQHYVNTGTIAQF
jgi:hypothetical protein